MNRITITYSSDGTVMCHAACSRLVPSMAADSYSSGSIDDIAAR